MHRSTGSWIQIGLGVLVASFLLCPAAFGSSQERSKFKSEMTNTGVDSDAAGKLKWKLQSESAKLELRLRGLDPATQYRILVDSEVQATLQPATNGRARVRFRSRIHSGSELLDFDPRGAMIAIDDGAQSVLEAVGSADGESEQSSSEESTVAEGDSSAESTERIKARFRSRKNGRTEFKVEIHVEQPGDYQLFVGGIERATIAATGSPARGRVKFRSPAKSGKLDLDFDPRGEALDLVQDDSVIVSGTLSARVEDVNVCEFSETGGLLSAVEATRGTAKARHRVREDCDQDLRIEVEDVEAGDYAVCQGETLIGTLFADEDEEGEVEGELEFKRHASSDEDDESGESPLDFEVDLAAISIRWPGEDVEAENACPATPVLFQGPDSSPGSCAIEDTRTPVPASEADRAQGAEAVARYRVRDDCERDLAVEVEDLQDAGTDLVCVGGLVRGRVVVAEDPESEELEGEIEFSTAPDGDESLLDFEVDLATVEVREDVLDAVIGDPCPDSTLLFGGAELEPEPETCAFAEWERVLLNQGLDADAKGKARLRMRADCSQNFRVEIENLPLGDYELVLQTEGDSEFLPSSLGDPDPETGDIEGEWVFDSFAEEGEMPFLPLLNDRPLTVKIRSLGSDTSLLERVFE